MYIINLLDCTQGCVYNIILISYWKNVELFTSSGVKPVFSGISSASFLIIFITIRLWVFLRYNHGFPQQGNRGCQTYPGCATAPPTLWPIIVLSNTCNQESVVCPCRVPLHRPVLLTVIRGIRLDIFRQKLPFPYGDRHPHVTYCSSDQAHSASQTASRSVQPFLHGSQMICSTMHRQWGRNPQNCPFLGISSPCWRRIDPIGNIHKHLVKIKRVVPEIS